MCKTNVLCQKPRTKETDKPNRNLSVDQNAAKKICGKEYVSISERGRYRFTGNYGQKTHKKNTQIIITTGGQK